MLHYASLPRRLALEGRDTPRSAVSYFTIQLELNCKYDPRYHNESFSDGSLDNPENLHQQERVFS